MTVVAPLLLSFLSHYFNGDNDIKLAIIYGLLMGLSFFINTISQFHEAYKSVMCGMRVRLQLNALVYKKVLGFVLTKNNSTLF
jgi:hypothetical protein